MKLLEKIYFLLSAFWFKCKKIHLGKKCKIWLNGSVYNGQFLHIGDKCVLHKNWQINIYPTKNIPEPKISIGNNVDIGRNFTCYCAGDISIGDNVLIGGNILITDNNHGMDPKKVSYRDQKLDIKNTAIGEGAWIGEGCCVLAGSVIGKKSIIGANSVVIGNVPPFSVAVGSPAQVIKRYDHVNQLWRSVNEKN